MTTFVRVEHTVPSLKSKLKQSISMINPYTDNNLALLSDNNVSSGKDNFTFSPVSSEIIIEIMGYVTLGLAEIANNAIDIPASLYKWHIWLNRMNEWMQNNKAVNFAEFRDDIKLSAGLYFMSDSNLKNTVDVVNKATNARLGPLLPFDYNTLINALNRGLAGCSFNEQSSSTETSMDVPLVGNSQIQFTENKIKRTNFLAFVKEVNRIAKYVNTDQPNLLSQKTTPVLQQSSQVFKSIENFGNQKSSYNRFTSFLSNIPLWILVTILMGIFYYFIKSNKTNSIDTSIPSWSATGGSRIYNISEFNPLN